jgi:hypothetical protein
MSSAGFEPAIPAVKRLQTHALDRAATGIGDNCNSPVRDFPSMTADKLCPECDIVDKVIELWLPAEAPARIAPSVRPSVLRK